jgi:hypothetical protein
MRSRKKKNPVSEAVIFAVGTTVGIVVGTVLATWLVETLKANGQLPGGQVGALPPSEAS